MRAVRWHGRGDVRVEEVPDPVPGPGQVLVRVELCGICGTDVEEYRHGPVTIPVAGPHPLTGRSAPVVLGHEPLGSVVAAGPGTAAPPSGTRVVPDVVLGCGTCWWCRRHQEGLCERHAVRGLHVDGGLAELMLADAGTLVTVDAALPAHAAVLAEPLSVAVRAVGKAGDLTGATVAVHGAGTIGLLTVQVARAAGAAVVAVDLVEHRRTLAVAAGAAVAGRPEQAARLVAEFTGGRGADVVFECAGQATVLPDVIALSRRGGTVVLVGFADALAPLPLLPVVLGERHLIGTAAHLWDTDVTSAVRMLSSGVVDADLLPTRVIGLDEVPCVLADSAPEVLKVAVRP